MFRRLSTALLFATTITLLPPHAHAGFKSGPSFHPASIRPMAWHPRVAGTHGKKLHGFHRFARHHHKRSLDWALPVYYGSSYDTAAQTADVDPALPPDYSAYFAPRERAFYRTGCRSEEVSVTSAHGPTTVTVTRCSVPIPELPPLK